MKAAPVFAFLGLVALAGCELEAPPPQSGPGWGGPVYGGPVYGGPGYGGPGWSGRPPSGEINVARAERACVAQAERQGLRVRRLVSTEIVTGSRGRVIGTQTILRVSRGGRTYPVRCNFTFETREARITSIRRA
jgi:hypothetical protein